MRGQAWMMAILLPSIGGHECTLAGRRRMRQMSYSFVHESHARCALSSSSCSMPHALMRCAVPRLFVASDSSDILNEAKLSSG